MRRQNPETTRHELTAIAAHLEDYLLGNDLYKTITVTTPTGEYLIKMTLGGMVERMDELEAQGGASDAVRQAREALERVKRMMPDRYYERLAREAKSYADSWNWFLQNCWEGEARCRADYAQEVETRLRLERLFEEGGEHADLAASRQRVRSLDQRLRDIWQEGNQPLIGDSSRYPREQYWWLYGSPRPRENG
jgi:hypothetical protein